MLNKLKKFYDSRTSRERLLLFMLLWTAIIIWLSTSISTQRKLSAEKSDLLAKIESAELLISQKSSVEKKLQKQKQKFDSSKMIEDLRVEVEKIVRAQGIANFGMTFAPEQKSDKMTIYTLNLSIQREGMEKLVALEREFAKLAPYLSVKSAELNSDGKGVMSARYEIRSFEFKM